MQEFIILSLCFGLIKIINKFIDRIIFPLILINKLKNWDSKKIDSLSKILGSTKDKSKLKLPKITDTFNKFKDTG